MKVSFNWPLKCPRNPQSFVDFVQKMANRLIVGEFRYGSPQSKQRYMSRLTLELRTYKKTGNSEHLLNIANYAWLESVAPENPKNHFNPLVGSATRHRFGGERHEGD